jgi:hypothetical protein
MGVDWLRSCHTSVWRFYKNSPDALTVGRFYFCDPNAPALPYAHDFYSATWTHGDEQSPLRTGPVQDAKRPWFNGSLDINFPPPRALGSAAQFDGDLVLPADVNHRTLRAGIPDLCWIAAGVPFVDFDLVADLNNCCLRSMYARLIELLYADDTDPITEFFATWLGEHVIPSFFPVEGLLPAMAIVVTPVYTIVVCSGTDNFQQLAMQAFYGLIPPANQGNVRTNNVWFQLAQTITRRLNDLGSNALAPIVFAAHSYGAAGCSILSILMRKFDPARRIHLLTFGMPKPTDSAGQAVLETITQKHVYNFGDLVPNVPFSTEQLAPLIGTTGAAIADAWGLWVGAPEYTRQTVDGTKTLGPLEPLSTGYILPLVIRALTGQPIAAVAPHLIDEYLRRSCLQCNCPRWPFEESTWEILFPIGCPPAALELTALVSAEDELELTALVPAIEELELTALVPARALLGLEIPPLLPAFGQVVLTAQVPAIEELELTALVPAIGDTGLADPTLLFVSVGLGGWTIAETSLGLTSPITSPADALLGLHGRTLLDIALGLDAIIPAIGNIGLDESTPAYGHLGLGIDIPRCAGCPDIIPPTVLHFTIACPALPAIDGYSFPVPLVSVSGGLCNWFLDFTPAPGGDVAALFEVDPAYPGYVYSRVFYRTTGGDTYDTLVVFVTDFACYPMFAAFSALLIKNGIPTADVMDWSVAE